MTSFALHLQTTVGLHARGGGVARARGERGAEGSEGCRAGYGRMRGTDKKKVTDNSAKIEVARMPPCEQEQASFREQEASVCEKEESGGARNPFRQRDLVHRQDLVRRQTRPFT